MKPFLLSIRISISRIRAEVNRENGCNNKEKDKAST
jgi:hypothetical protein